MSSETQAKQINPVTLFPAKRHGQVWIIKKNSHSWLLQLLTILGIPILTVVLMIPSGIKSIFYLMQIANNFGMIQTVSNGTMHLIIPLVSLNASRHSS